MDGNLFAMVKVAKPLHDLVGLGQEVEGQVVLTVMPGDCLDLRGNGSKRRHRLPEVARRGIAQTDQFRPKIGVVEDAAIRTPMMISIRNSLSTRLINRLSSRHRQPS